MLHTIEMEPSAVGTTIHFRYGGPKTRREAAALEVIAPAYGQALRSSIPSRSNIHSTLDVGRRVPNTSPASSRKVEPLLHQSQSSDV